MVLSSRAFKTKGFIKTKSLGWVAGGMGGWPDGWVAGGMGG
jgi:hypothetical protein